MLYLISLHLIAVICWFAGLFYLPRLFVYHAMTQSEAVKSQFEMMEHKLYFYIMTPAMIITVLTGLGLMAFYLLPDHSGGLIWFWIKLFLVALLLVFHFYCGYFLQVFKANQNRHSHRFYRGFNEIPTILLICIILLTIVQPF